MTELFDKEIIEETVVKLHKFAGTKLPNDVSKALIEMYEKETKPTSKAALKTIVENFGIPDTSQY